MSAAGKKILRGATSLAVLLVIVFVAYHIGHFIGGEYARMRN